MSNESSMLAETSGETVSLAAVTPISASNPMLTEKVESSAISAP